ncbi:hypothetical protein Mgra_00007065 [Meloidogyne graminicola]|uniref:Uncharacterized protein n=1 Tax=Meloidogyne graminicola TaxID=189291 RepID=A0A8S9ZJY1_9BILA|nr:hypothetical protein Mgra_00007065 [Meloidogyne graminicola]
MQNSKINLHPNSYGPHVQNIFIERECNTISNQQSPVKVLMAHECVSYYLPSSSYQSFSSSDEDYNEKQMLRRSLIRIFFMGLFLIIFVIVVYKVIEKEVTKRIELERRNITFKN